jgi:drug/metabolite transporter (DMT)-like permease
VRARVHSDADRKLRVVAALVALYVIWGTTYYVIRLAVQEIPPLSMAAIRFLLPGAALYAWRRLRGSPAPGRRDWGRAALLGTLMLAIGNGTVSVAETRMPSGVAALLVAMVPMWAVGLDWGLDRNRPPARVVAGLLLGICGVAVLGAFDTGGWTCQEGCLEAYTPAFVLLVAVGSACWALGSLRSRKGEAPRDFWLDLGMQMLAGGTVLALAGAVLGEPARFDPAQVPWEAWAGVLYLSVLGSVVALGCFLWLLRTTSPAVATTYAFVNPAVAVLLAAALGETPTSWPVLAASGLIVAGVALIVSGRARGKATAPTASEAVAQGER